MRPERYGDARRPLPHGRGREQARHVTARCAPFTDAGEVGEHPSRQDDREIRVAVVAQAGRIEKPGGVQGRSRTKTCRREGRLALRGEPGRVVSARRCRLWDTRALSFRKKCMCFFVARCLASRFDHAPFVFRARRTHSRPPSAASPSPGASRSSPSSRPWRAGRRRPPRWGRPGRSGTASIGKSKSDSNERIFAAAAPAGPARRRRGRPPRAPPPTRSRPEGAAEDAAACSYTACAPAPGARAPSTRARAGPCAPLKYLRLGARVCRADRRRRGHAHAHAHARGDVPRVPLRGHAMRAAGVHVPRAVHGERRVRLRELLLRQARLAARRLRKRRGGVFRVSRRVSRGEDDLLRQHFHAFRAPPPPALDFLASTPANTAGTDSTGRPRRLDVQPFPGARLVLPAGRRTRRASRRAWRLAAVAGDGRRDGALRGVDGGLVRVVARRASGRGGALHLRVRVPRRRRRQPSRPPPQPPPRATRARASLGGFVRRERVRALARRRVLERRGRLAGWLRFPARRPVSGGSGSGAFEALSGRSPGRGTTAPPRRPSLSDGGAAASEPSRLTSTDREGESGRHGGQAVVRGAGPPFGYRPQAGSGSVVRGPLRRARVSSPGARRRAPPRFPPRGSPRPTVATRRQLVRGGVHRTTLHRPHGAPPREP